MTIIRVGYDTTAGVFIIGEQGVYPAHSIVAALRDGRVRLRTLAGRTELNMRWQNVVDLDGNAFRSADDLMTWLSAQTVMQPQSPPVTDLLAAYILAKS